MGFKQGFGDKAGRNTANAVFNLLGIDFSDRRRISFDKSRSKQAEARAKLFETRAEIEEKNALNLIDEAVLDNVDQVVLSDFSTDPNELCAQLAILVVQVETNSWGMVLDDEAKIRNKYPSAVLSKLKIGVKMLERLDPNNPQIDDFQSAIRKAKWRKFFGKHIYLVFIFAFALFVTIMAISEEHPGFWQNNWGYFVAAGVLILGIIIAVCIRRIKKRNARLDAYQQERINQKRTVSAENKQATISTHIDEKIENIPASKPENTERAPITRSEKLKERYSKLWEKYASLNDIMERGFTACLTTSQKDFLIVGFNPSFDALKGNTLYPFPISLRGYWGNVNKMILSREMNLRENSEYIDLFAFRESDQETAMKEIIQNPKMFPYIVEQVAMTQDIIENVIKPKVIVVKNKAAWAFFGKLPQFTWMGYCFEHIKTEQPGEVYRINGFRNEKDRINAHFTKSNIDGAIVLFTTHTAVDSYPSPQYLASLLQLY